MEHDFQYISKHDPRVKAAYVDLMLLLQEVREELKKHYTFQHDLVGSYARNMITYDQNRMSDSILTLTSIRIMTRKNMMPNRSNCSSKRLWIIM